MTKGKRTRKSVLPGFGRDERAVSDVLGSVMLIGVTVVAAAGFGVLLVAYEGPELAQNTRLGVSIVPSGTSWGTGNERLEVTHLGGHALRADDTTIRYTLNGQTTTLTGASLGSAFADGRLTIGERWSRPVLAYLNDAADIDVTVGGGTGSLLTSSRVLAGAFGSATCLSDIAPPTASLWTQAPADVDSLTTGAVSVTVKIADGCSGVDSTVVPRLYWCVATSCTIPTSFTDAGPMTNTGVNIWTGSVPHSGSWLTDAILGKSLQYYVSPVKDLNGNTGQTAANVDVVNLIATHTYVTSANANSGTVADLGNARSAADSSAVATLTEKGSLGAPGSAGPTKRSGATATGSGTSSPTNALASDDARATLSAAGHTLDVSGFTVPSNAASITAVTIGFEGRKSGSQGTDPTARIDYRVTGSFNQGQVFAVTNANTDSDYTRTLTGSFSLADISGMTVRIVDVTTSNRNIQVDHVFVTITYTTTAQTTYSMNVELEWVGVPVGTLQNLELRYRVANPGDTFQVQVWNGLSWRTCTGTLAATTLTTFTCSLVLPAEYDAGAPTIRFVDVTPTGTTQGVLYLDYARMATA